MSNEATLLFQQCADILKILQATFPVQHDLRLQCVVLIFPNHFGRLWRAPAQCNELVQWSNLQPESQLEPYPIILGATKAGHFVKLVMFRRLQTKPKVPSPNGPFPTNAYLCIGSRVASRQCRLLWISIWYPEKWMTVPIGSMYAIYPPVNSMCNLGAELCNHKCSIRFFLASTKLKQGAHHRM